MNNCRSLKPGLNAAAESGLFKLDSDEGMDIVMVIKSNVGCVDYKVELANMGPPVIDVESITCGESCDMTRGVDEYRVVCTCRSG